MKDWIDLLRVLARRLTAGLAFAVAMVIVIALLGDRIPADYRALPYVVIALGYGVYATVQIVRARSQPSSQPPVPQRNVQARDIENTTIVTGDHNLVVHIVEGYAKRAAVASQTLEEQVRGYLDWVCDRYGHITLRGIERGGRQVVELPLEQVYVPLQATYTPEETRQEDAAAMREVERHITLDQVLGLGPLIILTGGPGSGKTTVLQHILWTLAEALRRDNPALAAERLGLRSPLPLPIYLPLSLYARYLRNLPADAPAEKRTLAAFVNDYLLRNQSYLGLSPDFFAHLLQWEQHHVLLLLDGMDEVPTEEERVKVVQDIENLVAGKPNLRVVVTSRIAAYRGRAVLGQGFRHVRVLPLEEEHIGRMVRAAYRAIYPQAPAEAGHQSDDLLRGIRRLEAERRQRLGERAEPLVDAPIMVRLLLIVHFNERKLPDQRADLYRKAVDAMLRPDYALDVEVTQQIESRLGNLGLAREMLQFLAFHMHDQGEAQGREIEETALRRILTQEETYRPYVDALIALTRQRGTLLEERGGLYRFLHLSFQEFLTARYLAEEMTEDDLFAFLRERVTASWWREPILLLLGYLDLDKPRRARRLVLALSGADPESPVHKWPWEAQLAAAELATTAYQEAQNRPDETQRRLYDRLRIFLRREVQTEAFLPPVLLASVGDVLDRWGYRPPDLYTFVPIPDEADRPAFYIAKYPVTNEQYARFLEAEDFADPDLWRGFPKFSEPRGGDLDAIERIGDWGDEGWRWLQEALRDKDLSPDGKVVLPRYWNDPRFGIARPSAPVVGVTWYEANAYARWVRRHWAELEEAQQNPGLQPHEIRLPTEAEWVRAAGGLEPQSRYPWDLPGKATTDEKEVLRRANVGESDIGRTTPVWLYPLGRSQPYEVWDFGGNVWEWMANLRTETSQFTTVPVRGGSWRKVYWESATGSFREGAILQKRLQVVPALPPAFEVGLRLFLFE